jgi:major type 1 subunit fimbrin (pilin)
MKKLVSALGLGLLLSSTATFAADGTIQFSGAIIDNGCTVTNSPGNPLTVSMKSYSTDTLNGAAGKTTSPQPFNIELTNCPTTTATLKFTGTADASNDLSLDPAATVAAATGVAVRILDASGQKVDINQDIDLGTLTGGTDTFKFSAQYVSNAATVTAGDANATAQFILAYN